MADPAIPTLSSIPVITQEGIPVQPNTALINMLGRLQLGRSGGTTPSAAVFQQIKSAIMASPNLIAELNAASLDGTWGFLHSIVHSSTGNGVCYNPRNHSIVITQNYLDSMDQALESSNDPQNLLIDVLGHETCHAMDAGNLSLFRQEVAQSLQSAFAAEPDEDITVVLLNYKNWLTVDEASTNFAGWNALLGTLGTTTPSLQALVALVQSASLTTELVVGWATGLRAGRDGITLLPSEEIDNTAGGLATMSDHNTAIEMPIMGERLGSYSQQEYNIMEAVNALNFPFAVARSNPVKVNLSELGIGSKGGAGDPFPQLANW